MSTLLHTCVQGMDCETALSDCLAEDWIPLNLCMVGSEHFVKLLHGSF